MSALNDPKLADALVAEARKHADDLRNIRMVLQCIAPERLGELDEPQPATPASPARAKSGKRGPRKARAAKPEKKPEQPKAGKRGRKPMNKCSQCLVPLPKAELVTIIDPDDGKDLVCCEACANKLQHPTERSS